MKRILLYIRSNSVHAIAIALVIATLIRLAIFAPSEGKEPITGDEIYNANMAEGIQIVLEKPDSVEAVDLSGLNRKIVDECLDLIPDLDNIIFVNPYKGIMYVNGREISFTRDHVVPGSNTPSTTVMTLDDDNAERFTNWLSESGIVIEPNFTPEKLTLPTLTAIAAKIGIDGNKG